MSSNQSYVHGASDKQLIGQTIGRFFDDACARHAGREALVVRHQNVRLTYAQLKSRVDALACGLMRLGLAPGEPIPNQDYIAGEVSEALSARFGVPASVTFLEKGAIGLKGFIKMQRVVDAE